MFLLFFPMCQCKCLRFLFYFVLFFADSFSYSCTMLHVKDSSELSVTLTLSSVSVEFADVTYDTEIGVGKPLVLTCKTVKPVEECQWSWKSDKTPDSVLMRQFQSFGNESRDCSLRFETVASEHEGIWTCAARYEWQTTFKAAHPIQLTVLTGNSNAII